MILRLQSYQTFLYIFAERIINGDTQGSFAKQVEMTRENELEHSLLEMNGAHESG